MDTRGYYKFRPYEDSHPGFWAIIGPEEMVTEKGLDENYHAVLEMLEKRPEDRRARD